MINFSEIYQVILNNFLIPVSHIKNLVAVRIVAGPVSIGSDPLEQFVIPDSGDEIKATTSDSRVLVLAETTHIHRSIV